MKGYKSRFEAVIPSWAVDEAEGNKYLIFKGKEPVRFDLEGFDGINWSMQRVFSISGQVCVRGLKRVSPSRFLSLSY
jgi:hypothetical protein